MLSRRDFLSLAALSTAWSAAPLRAQERFSLFVGSNPESVTRMIELAALRDGETVIDLGSGDGRIVFAAAQARPNLRGMGVDINEELVTKANEAARAQGLASRVQFFHRNAFDADISNVDVIFMWLFPELMRLLRPKILAEAKPGTRIVAATWDMGSWPADASDDRGGGVQAIRRWIVPARIDGGWEWQIALRGRTHRFGALIEQRMQQVEGAVRVANRREVMQYMILRGDTVQFSLRMSLPETGFANLVHVGRVQGDTIEGSIAAELPKLGEDAEGMDEFHLPWKARRTADHGFFAPTGTSLR
jgi:SAM-dependent methyltransferase